MKPGRHRFKGGRNRALVCSEHVADRESGPSADPAWRGVDLGPYAVLCNRPPRHPVHLRWWQFRAAARGDADRPTGADEPHPFHMSSYGTEPRCWCGRYSAATVHAAGDSRPTEDWATETNRHSLESIRRLKAEATGD